MLTEHGGIGSI